MAETSFDDQPKGEEEKDLSTAVNTSAGNTLVKETTEDKIEEDCTVAEAEAILADTSDDIVKIGATYDEPIAIPTIADTTEDNGDEVQVVCDDKVSLPVTEGAGGETKNSSVPGRDAHIFDCTVPDDPDDDLEGNIDLDEIEDKDEEEEEMTYISVYTGKAVGTPLSKKNAKKSTSTAEKKTSCSSGAQSESKPDSSSSRYQFLALRRGRTAASCIFLDEKEFNAQIANYPAEYKGFHKMDEAVSYITSDPMFMIKALYKKRKRNYDPSEQQRKKARESYDEPSWEGFYIQLQQFHREFGNTDVPSILIYRPLHKWVKTQQKEFRDFVKGLPSEMTEGRAQLLLGINFDFGCTSNNNKRNKHFDDYCQELVNYRARNNNTDPRAGTTLNAWVQRVRKKYEDNQSGKNTMPQDKRMALELIGFKWTKEPDENCKKRGKKFLADDNNPPPVKPTDAASSYTAMRAASLNGKAAVAYASASMGGTTGNSKKENLSRYSTMDGLVAILPKDSPSKNDGTTQAGSNTIAKTPQQANMNRMPPPMAYTPMMHPMPGYPAPMNPYMPNMWSPYNNYHTPAKPTQAGKKDTSPQSKTKLKKDHYPQDGVRAKKWLETFKELEKFKEENGNFDVDDDSDLGKWCEAQRRNYRQLQKGAKSGILSDERAKKLKELGFDLDSKREKKARSTWYVRFEEARQFQEENGHCDVPTKGRLYNWLLDQKSVVSFSFSLYDTL